jgi:hypothetical protein
VGVGEGEGIFGVSGVEVGFLRMGHGVKGKCCFWDDDPLPPLLLRESVSVETLSQKHVERLQDCKYYCHHDCISSAK